MSGLALGAALLPVRRVLGSLPRWAWIALAIASAALLGALWHGHAVKKHDRALRAQVTAEIQAQTKKLIDGLNARNEALVTELRRKNDETARIIVHTADVVRVSGPGKAQCRAVIPAPAGEHVAASGTGDAAVAAVPSGQGVDLIGLPFAPTVDFAEQHDLNRAEAIAWREWYARIVKEWPSRKPEG